LGINQPTDIASEFGVGFGGQEAMGCGVCGEGIGLKVYGEIEETAGVEDEERGEGEAEGWVSINGPAISSILASIISSETSL